MANLIIHLFTLFIIHFITYIKFSKLLILGIIIDVIYMILYVYNVEVGIIQYLFPFLLIFLSFSVNLYTYFKLVILYYAFSSLLGGVSLTLLVSGNLKYFLILLIYFVIFIISLIFFNRKEVDLSYKISFRFKSTNYIFNAFLDTGCNLMYKSYPVIIINKKYEFNIYSDSYIKFTTGSGETIKKVYLINELEICKKKIKCYCIFLDIDYEAIIGFNLI